MIDFLKFFGGSSLVLILVAWLVRTLVSRGLEAQLETYKARLEANTQVEIERLRSQLALAAAERQIVFVELHGKRAEAILDLNKKIAALCSRAEDFTNPWESPGEPSKREKLVEFARAGSSFREAYDSSSIFFSPQTCSKLERLEDAVRSATNRMMAHFMMPDDIRDNAGLMKDWPAAWKAVKNEVPSVREELTMEFRELLGVISRNSDPSGAPPNVSGVHPVTID